MDASSIGSHEINSLSESLIADTHSLAKSSLNGGLNADADYEVKGANGTATVTMNGGEDARDVAKAFNLVTGSTGVTATAVTRAKISSLSASDHYSFKLQGRDQNASVVNATISNVNDLNYTKRFN